jgi:hypothetical protein
MTSTLGGEADAARETRLEARTEARGMRDRMERATRSGKRRPRSRRFPDDIRT